MQELTNKEKIFLIKLTKLKPQLYNGYYRFTKGNKHFKRSRVLMQLHLNKKLSIFDVIHHKDKNKSNDNIENLQILNRENHTSQHTSGIRRKH